MTHATMMIRAMPRIVTTILAINAWVLFRFALVISFLFLLSRHPIDKLRGITPINNPPMNRFPIDQGSQSRILRASSVTVEADELGY